MASVENQRDSVPLVLIGEAPSGRTHLSVSCAQELQQSRQVPTEAGTVHFSSNFGSLDTLNVFTRCGFSPRADHTRCTVSLDTPTLVAIVRQDQCVSPSGLEFIVRARISSITVCGIVGFTPRPGRTRPNLLS